MRQKHHQMASASGGDGDKSKADDALDEKLKELGAEFLDDEVPDSLLDVLRRGMTSGGAKKPAGDHDQHGEDGDKQQNGDS